MINYTINPGDTLTAIARHFGVSVTEIANANGITDVDVIQAGATLIIPGSDAEQLTPVTITARKVTPTRYATPIPGTGGPVFNLQDWLKPPKLYYALAVIAIGSFLFSKKRR